MEKQLRQFNKYLDNHYVKGWDNLCRKYGTLCSYKKGETFIALGQTARYIGLIKSGSVKYVVYTSDGKERVINLETVGGYAASFPFSLRGLPSIFSVIVNSDSEIYCLSVQKIMELSRQDENIRDIINQALEAVFYMIYDRYVDFYALAPKERYEQLLKKCPQLFEIFQLKDIASYLNITPQHLRRLKKS